MIFGDIIKQRGFNLKADRIGPDMPFTHWKLYFKKSMLALCQSKFLKFANSAEFRAGAYAIGCSKIEIGERVVIRPQCMLFGDSITSEKTITIENHVMLGSGVHIYVSNHRFDTVEIPLIDQGHYLPKPVVLKEGCWIGANTVILPGVIIGENAVVGAGSVVTKSIPPGVVAAGNPAKVIKEIGL